MGTRYADEVVAARVAFDRLAPTYDVAVSGEIFGILRQRTHDVLGRTFSSGCRVLEIGCGTGLDTAFLTSRGVRVVACDPAEGMVLCTTRRLARQGFDHAVTVLPFGLDEIASYLDALGDPPGFDGIVSNFGALNCVERLDALGEIAERHLRPGGTLLLGVMGRSCAWEALYFSITGRPELARRRRSDGPVDVPVAGIAVPTFYHRTSDIRAALGGNVTLRAMHGIGVVVPPPYLEARWQQLPRAVRHLCAATDRLLAPWPPFNRWGDHVLLHFTKRRAAHV